MLARKTKSFAFAAFIAACSGIVLFAPLSGVGASANLCRRA